MHWKQHSHLGRSIKSVFSGRLDIARHTNMLSQWWVGVYSQQPSCYKNCTRNCIRNKTFLFVKIETWNFQGCFGGFLLFFVLFEAVLTQQALSQITFHLSLASWELFFGWDFVIMIFGSPKKVPQKATRKPGKEIGSWKNDLSIWKKLTLHLKTLRSVML